MIRARTVAAMAIAAATAIGVSLVGLSPATAAPGDAFDPAKPSILIVQGTPSQLSVAQADAAGTYSFVNEGSAVTPGYNGIGYNTADNYLYGFVETANGGTIPDGAVVRIGQGGVVTRVGLQTFQPVPGTYGFNVGAINPVDGLLYATETVDNKMYVIDPANGGLAAAHPAAIPLSASMNSVGQVSDWTASGGFLWGLGDNNKLSRINMTTGDVNTFNVPGIDTGFAGAAWTYLDGDLGFSHNASGQINKIHVANPAALAPTFTVVKVSTGPASTKNDGAMVPGLPADLAITKTASAIGANGAVTYSITVKNNGAGWSTGWTMKDTVPAEVQGIAASSTGSTCTVAGQVVTCVGGQLIPGASATITVTGSVVAGTTSIVTNTASVTGNEPDPNAGNNSASAAVTPAIDDDVTAPDTGAQRASAWQPWAAVGAGLAVLVAMMAQVAAKRRRA